MKYFGSIVVAALLFIQCDTALSDNTCSLCIDESNPYNRSVCLYNYSKTSVTEGKPAKEGMACLLNAWKERDGAASGLISDAFLLHIEKAPKTFFKVMSKSEPVFKEWMNGLASNSFVWHKEPPSPLEAWRKKLISVLEGCGTMDKDSESLKGRVVTTLEKIKPRQIN